LTEPDLSDLFARSISPRELVVSAADALIAIDRLETADVKVLGWEGWLEWSDGKHSHDSQAQGTVDLSPLSVAEAASFCRETIREAAEQWEESPRPNATRFYCLTF
jgi:hypothetical protein